jgi:hypothetical protein
MDITFTKHAEHRLIKRKVSKDEILEIIKYPTEIKKKYGKYYFQKELVRGKVVVVCEKTQNHINIIPLYWI